MSGSVQLPNILKALNLDESTENTAAFSPAGMIPTEVTNATQFKAYVCYGITADEVETRYAGQEFDLATLESQFSSHCKDYNEPISAKASKAVEFATKILFEVGPQIRTEKKSKGDKVVKFIFPYVKQDIVEKKEVNKLSMHTVFVSTFKEAVYTGTNSNVTLVMTFKQAGILATKIMNKVAEYIYKKDTKTIFTPLAGAIFSKDDIPIIAIELKMPAVDIVKINASCCSGGQHLEDSRIECAIASTISATKKMTDKNVRESIMSKMVKQYTKKLKAYDEEVFEILCKYALGGVPTGLDSKTLITIYESVQVKEANAREQARQKRLNEMRTMINNINVPGTSGKSAEVAKPAEEPQKGDIKAADKPPKVSKRPTKSDGSQQADLSGDDDTGKSTYLTQEQFQKEKDEGPKKPKQ